MPSQDTYNSALTDADQDVMACQTSLICEGNPLTCPFFLTSVLVWQDQANLSVIVILRNCWPSWLKFPSMQRYMVTTLKFLITYNHLLGYTVRRELHLLRQRSQSYQLYFLCFIFLQFLLCSLSIWDQASEQFQLNGIAVMSGERIME